MYVACPSCRTLYQIQAQHLHAAGGQVRCASCRTTFVATDAVFDDPAQALAYAEKRHVERDIEALVSRALEQVPGGEERQQPVPGEPESLAPGEVPGGAQPDGQEEVIPESGDRSGVAEWAEPGAPEDAHLPEEAEAEPVQPSGNEPFLGGDEPTHELWPEAPDTELPASRADAPVRHGGEALHAGAEAGAASPVMHYADLDLQAQPLAAEFVVSPRRRPEAESAVPHVLLLEDEYHDHVSHSAWGAIAAALLLTALLVGQYGYVERYRLAAVPQLRPLLETGCRLLGCELPLRSEIAQVEIVEREVRDHPNVSDALLISATFVNRADFVQPFPVFSVSFSDVSGTLVAARRFRPAEYLSDSQNAARGMQPGERAQLMLEVVDPGNSAVSFQFDFL